MKLADFYLHVFSLFSDRTLVLGSNEQIENLYINYMLEHRFWSPGGLGALTTGRLCPDISPKDFRVSKKT